MADPAAPQETGHAADTIVAVADLPEGLFIGAAWKARENAVILTHDGDCVALPLETAIALRDALSVAIDIPVRAAELAAFDRDSG
ncbi:hypothetical protein [Sphingopyxis granuli]|uniref:hypothetical protein n=1 Tax=Sphingopyxis granuli TaxID=267128 RepID=UPI001BAF3E0E|nr:hypothetical protein [Sphingopyxis granuli]QUM73324.1 hypothetical protein ICN83_05410 [Sphingopyxis granuli]